MTTFVIVPGTYIIKGKEEQQQYQDLAHNTVYTDYTEHAERENQQQSVQKAPTQTHTYTPYSFNMCEYSGLSVFGVNYFVIPDYKEGIFVAMAKASFGQSLCVSGH